MSDRPTDARRRFRWEYVVVGLLAIGVRLLYVADSRGGFGGYYGYDAGVYYAASDALLHGRLPYRDFVLLHPPGLMLALTPFAGLGDLVGDHTGFVVGNVAFAGLGGVNAMLVVAVARRLSVGRPAAAIAGVAYAVWYTVYVGEWEIRLEPLANFSMLLGLFALTGYRRRPRAAVLAGAGFALGCAASTKITWLAPLAVALVWFLVDTRAWRRALVLLGGAVTAFVVVDGPFFVAAPKQMLHMIALDQLDRPLSGGRKISRLAFLTGLPGDHHYRLVIRLALAAGFLLFLLIVAALAWRLRAARLPVALMVVHLAVLLQSPYFAYYYGVFLAVPVCLSLAAAIQVAARSAEASPRWRPASRALTVVPLLVIVLASGVVLSRERTTPAPFPSGRLRQAAAKVRCVMSDAPIALIELDALSRGLHDGCPNWVDVSGRTYGPDRPRTVNGKAVVNRPHNRLWQTAVRHYLTSGNAVIVIRRQTGLSPATRRDVLRGRPLAREDGRTLYATP